MPFPDSAFDDVVSSLVLHYLEDWDRTLAELRRVLRPGGRLIVSVDHPFTVWAIHHRDGLDPDYFATYQWTDDWPMGERTMSMSFWNRPLRAMTSAFTAAGFRVAVVHEPQPVPAARELFPDDYRVLMISPCFLFFVLQAG